MYIYLFIYFYLIVISFDEYNHTLKKHKIHYVLCIRTIRKLISPWKRAKIVEDKFSPSYSVGGAWTTERSPSRLRAFVHAFFPTSASTGPTKVFSKVEPSVGPTTSESQILQIPKHSEFCLYTFHKTARFPFKLAAYFFANIQTITRLIISRYNT